MGGIEVRRFRPKSDLAPGTAVGRSDRGCRIGGARPRSLRDAEGMGPDASLRFGPRFRQPEYLRVLEAIAEQDGPSELYLDMGRTEWAHANAMVPLIATVDRLTRQGWEFKLELPRSQFEEEYFVKAGWVAGFEGSPSPPILPGRSYLPLQRYQTGAELNRIFRSIVRRLFEETELAPGVLASLEWSIYEIADNVLNHAGGPGGWIQLITQRDRGLVELVVADGGVGIRTSLSEGYSDIADDIDAINRALTKGVTRGPEHGLGNGLAGVERVSEAGDGWLTLHTYGGATVVREGDRRDELRPEHPGTVVALTLPTDVEIDVEEVLWGPVTPSLEEAYLEPDEGGGGFHIEFRMSAECEALGNRATARVQRFKVKNLMGTFREPLVFDFAGARTMSASFADELFGRLAVELGEDQYRSLIRYRNLEGLNSATLGSVLDQRLSASGGSAHDG